MFRLSRNCFVHNYFFQKTNIQSSCYWYCNHCGTCVCVKAFVLCIFDLLWIDVFAENLVALEN